MEQKQIEIKQPIHLVVAPEALNVLLKGLEQLPLGLSRAVFADIESQVLKQIRPPENKVELKGAKPKR